MVQVVTIAIAFIRMMTSLQMFTFITQLLVSKSSVSWSAEPALLFEAVELYVVWCFFLMQWLLNVDYSFFDVVYILVICRAASTLLHVSC